MIVKEKHYFFFFNRTFNNDSTFELQRLEVRTKLVPNAVGEELENGVWTYSLPPELIVMLRFSKVNLTNFQN